MRDELKGCPFCGSEAEVLEEVVNAWTLEKHYHVECMNIECLAVSDVFTEPEFAIAWWNRRPQEVTNAAD